ncbi:hypothetical protein, partial [Vibrio sp.]|uniref:hypothetical protein n=1 Tax=Vibrio sp. TaxID=678 RepID=UPI003D10071D
MNSSPNQVAVAEMPGGNIVYAGSQMYMSWDGTGDPIFFTNINYTILDHGGNTVLPQKMIDLNPGPSLESFVHGPVIDVAPNGNIGMLWTNEVYDRDTKLSNVNLFMAVMDSDGNIIFGPSDLTGNTSWGSNATGDAFGYESPRITASDDGKFFISWGAYDQEPEGYIRDIYYGIRNNDGSQSIANAKLTNGVVGGDFNYEPALAALDGNKTLVAWHGSGETKYVVLNNDGSIAKASTAISGPGLINIDAVQLSDSNILLAGQNGSREIFFSILDGSTYLVNEPLSALQNPISASQNEYVSVTRDENGHGILTWADYSSQYIFYALVNSSGDVLTAPTILKEAEEYQYKFIDTSSQGYGNTTYSPAAWIEVLDKEIYGFVSPGTHEYAFKVQNLGSLG